MRVREFYNHKVAGGDYGIEIEIEGENLPLEITGWKIEEDPSLRGDFPNSKAEYVLPRPLNLDAIPGRLELINTAMKTYKSKPKFSYRCSTHVHRNVQELTKAELAAFLYTSVLVEPFMELFVDEDRIANRFALRFRDSTFTLDVIARFCEGGSFEHIHIGNGYRYASVNLDSVRNYGSVEFRMLHGTVDAKEIFNWVSLIDCIYKFSLRKTPKDIQKAFLKGDFLSQVFGDLHKDKFALVEKELKWQYSISLMIPGVCILTNEVVVRPSPPKVAPSFDEVIFDEEPEIRPAPRRRPVRPAQ